MIIKRYVRFPFFMILLIMIIGAACSSQSANPSTDFQESDIVGTWVAQYGEGITDTIQILSDGTYKQVYENTNNEYKFETDWKTWALETFADGRIWIYLDGGRYYLSGERIGELAGKGDPCPTEYPDCTHEKNPRLFYDPFNTDDNVDMVDRLVLTVRSSPEGEIFLYHMWTTPDRGFGIFGPDREIFIKHEK